MAYIEVDIVIPENPETGRDITIAEMGQEGYESFVETDSGLKAYIPGEHFKREFLNRLTIVVSSEFGIPRLSSREIEDVNWNARWESEYEPVSIPGFCFIRSPFHQGTGNHAYEIIIEPKMSFGTGHHETTWLMIDAMRDIVFDDKIVLDLGCGTGVLSIMSSLLGSKKVYGVDTDQWAYNNALENLGLNNIKNCKIIHGDISKVKNLTFNIILANITKNINIEYMSRYRDQCSEDGIILLSGFYSEDLDDIIKQASLYGFSYLKHKIKKNWVSVLFKSQE